MYAVSVILHSHTVNKKKRKKSTRQATLATLFQESERHVPRRFQRPVPGRKRKQIRQLHRAACITDTAHAPISGPAGGFRPHRPTAPPPHREPASQPACLPASLPACPAGRVRPRLIENRSQRRRSARAGMVTSTWHSIFSVSSAAVGNRRVASGGV